MKEARMDGQITFLYYPDLGAAAGLAAILAGKIHEPGKKVVLVLTGRNIAADKFLHIIKGG